MELMVLCVMHSGTHIHEHILMHEHMHTHTETLMHMLIKERIYSHMYSYTHTPNTHSDTFVHTQAAVTLNRRAEVYNGMGSLWPGVGVGFRCSKTGAFWPMSSTCRR